jgi:hypothetical protein
MDFVGVKPERRILKQQRLVRRDHLLVRTANGDRRLGSFRASVGAAKQNVSLRLQDRWRPGQPAQFVTDGDNRHRAGCPLLVDDALHPAQPLDWLADQQRLTVLDRATGEEEPW